MAIGRLRHWQGTFGGMRLVPTPHRGKAGSERSVLVEAYGSPLSVVVAGANVHDTKLLEQTLENIVVTRPECAEEDSQNLCLDKGITPPVAALSLPTVISPTVAVWARRSWTIWARKVTQPGARW
jgi:hypothetical protein